MRKMRNGSLRTVSKENGKEEISLRGTEGNRGQELAESLKGII